jgi:ubiquinone/menaquinone biosynthesis C-methylase UbiE
MDFTKYWKTRGQSYENELKNQTWLSKIEEKNQEQFLKRFLQKYSFKNILEIGCGNGRLTKFLLNISNFDSILAIDISEDLIMQAQKKFSNPKITFQNQDVLKFSSDKKFDLIFGGEILMHIPPINIQTVVKKLLHLCRGKLLFIEFYDPKNFDNNLSDYVFSHDYELIFRNAGIVNVNIHLIKHTPIQKVINLYAKMRKRKPFSKQALLEVTI